MQDNLTAGKYGISPAELHIKLSLISNFITITPPNVTIKASI